VHQIRFRPGLRPGPRWGSSRRSPRPPSRLGRGTPSPHSPPPRRVRRLVACGDSSSAPRSQNPLRIFFLLDTALSVPRYPNCVCIVACIQVLSLPVCRFHETCTESVSSPSIRLLIQSAVYRQNTGHVFSEHPHSCQCFIAKSDIT